jgi:hypothetical protein
MCNIEIEKGIVAKKPKGKPDLSEGIHFIVDMTRMGLAFADLRIDMWNDGMWHRFSECR